MKTQYECLAITRWPKTLTPWNGFLSVSNSTIAYRGTLHQEISHEQAITWKMLMGNPEYNEMVSAGNLIIKSYTNEKPKNDWSESLVAHISLMLADYYHEDEGKVFLTNLETENNERTIVSQATRRTSGPCFYLDRYDEDDLHIWIQSQSRAKSRWPLIHERLFRLLSSMSENESNQVTEAITSFIEAH